MCFCVIFLVQGGTRGFGVKGSLDHVVAVATTMDQTGVVLHLVEVRIYHPNAFILFSLKPGVDWRFKAGLCTHT